MQAEVARQMHEEMLERAAKDRLAAEVRALRRTRRRLARAERRMSGPRSTPPGSAGNSRPEPDRPALTADEGSHIAIADEGALVIDHGLYILADVLDPFPPGTGGLLVV